MSLPLPAGVERYLVITFFGEEENVF